MTKRAAISSNMSYNVVASQTGIDQVTELGCAGRNRRTGTMGGVAVYLATPVACNRNRLRAPNVQRGEV